MSKKNTERDDQATELRKLFNEVQGNGTNDLQTDKKTELTENGSVVLNESARDIDILNLPPRKEVHSNKKKRTRVKVNRPFARLSAVIIILIIIVIAVYYLWSAELIELPLK